MRKICQEDVIKAHLPIFADLEKVKQMLPDDVTREDIDGLTQIFRSYDIRMAIAGDKTFEKTEQEE